MHVYWLFGHFNDRDFPRLLLLDIALLREQLPFIFPYARTCWHEIVHIRPKRNHTQDILWIIQIPFTKMHNSHLKFNSCPCFVNFPHREWAKRRATGPFLALDTDRVYKYKRTDGTMFHASVTQFPSPITISFPGSVSFSITRFLSCSEKSMHLIFN